MTIEQIHGLCRAVEGIEGVNDVHLSPRRTALGPGTIVVTIRHEPKRIVNEEKGNWRWTMTTKFIDMVGNVRLTDPDQEGDES